MQKSRLAQRREQNNQSIKPKKTKTAPFLIAILIFVLIIFGVGSFVLFSGGVWDGKTKFSVVVAGSNGDINVEIFDPVSSQMTTIILPKDIEVQAANQLGTWKLGSIPKLGQDKKLSSEFLKNTVIKSFKFPIDSSDNLSMIDKIKIKLFLLTLGNADKSTINLKDTYYLIRTQLTDATLGYEIGTVMPASVQSFFYQNYNLNALINNETGSVSTGTMAGKVLDALGINVASLQTNDSKNFDCKVLTGDKNKNVAKKVAQVLNCQIVSQNPANNFDLELDLGSKFKSRF